MAKVSAVAIKLKELRNQAGLSMREIARLAGMEKPTYQHYEARYKRPYLPVDLVDRIEPILAARGIPPHEVRALAGAGTGGLEVSGAIAAEAIDWPEEKRYRMVLPPRISASLPPDVRAFEVMDASCNRLYPAGSVIFAAPIKPGAELAWGAQVVAEVKAPAGTIARMLMVASVSPMGDIVLENPTNDRRLQSAVILPRGPTRVGLLDASRRWSDGQHQKVVYELIAGDQAEIIGSVEWVLAPG
jgi:transcriptional regulator with XRE-family HTH domain